MGWQDDAVVQGKPRWESDPIIQLASAMPAIELTAGGRAPQLLQPSANPYSAGRYPLGRNYTVGDQARFRESDLLTGIEQRVYTQRVTKVDLDADRVELNGGRLIWDTMGNAIKAGDKEFDVPVQFTPAEFQVGKKWTAAFVRTRDGTEASMYYDLRIVRREKVSVPAGAFDAFRIEGQGWNRSVGKLLELTLWLVPGLNFLVKLERLNHNRKGRVKESERHELVDVRQQAKGI